MKEIKLLYCNIVTLVDDEDYERLNKHNWHVSESGSVTYPRRALDSRGRTIRMHREILSVPLGMEVDHKDGDGLNNQKSNLRICASSQNRANARSRSNTSSKHKGVTWVKANRKWKAQIGINGTKRHLGYFEDEEDAALAYNRTALSFYGEFARPNII